MLKRRLNERMCLCSTGEGTLARRLIDNPTLGSFKLLEKRRVLLEGEELEEHMATLRQHRTMERMKEHM